jgi:hypothetical protein
VHHGAVVANRNISHERQYLTLFIDRNVATLRGRRVEQTDHGSLEGADSRYLRGRKILSLRKLRQSGECLVAWVENHTVGCKVCTLDRFALQLSS